LLVLVPFLFFPLVDSRALITEIEGYQRGKLCIASKSGDGDRKKVPGTGLERKMEIEYRKEKRCKKKPD
jgi:hypothetical protein